MEKTNGKNMLRLKYVISCIGSNKKHKTLVKGLGFSKLNQEVVRPDTPEIRGMVAKIPHLVKILKTE
jgi:large subunit ribosomal protein L30